MYKPVKNAQVTARTLTILWPFLYWCMWCMIHFVCHCCTLYWFGWSLLSSFWYFFLKLLPSAPLLCR